MSDEDKRERRRAAARECMRRKRAREREERERMERGRVEREEGPAPKRTSRKAAEQARARVQRYLEHLAINDPAAPSGPPRSPSPDLLELAEEAFRRHTASLQEETSQPADTQASKPANPPANKPASKLASQPASKLASKPTGRPASKLANLPARRPASEPASVPTGEPAGKTVYGPANKSARAPAREPANQPTADQPEGQLAPQPTDQPPRQPAFQLPSPPPQEPASQLNNSQLAALVVRWELFPIPIGLGQRWAANAAPPEPARPLALTWPRAEELEEVERRLLRSRRLAYYLAPRRDQAKGGGHVEAASGRSAQTPRPHPHRLYGACVWGLPPQTRDQVPSSSSHLGGMRMRTRVGEIPGVKAIAFIAIAFTHNTAE